MAAHWLDELDGTPGHRRGAGLVGQPRRRVRLPRARPRADQPDRARGPRGSHGGIELDSRGRGQGRAYRGPRQPLRPRASRRRSGRPAGTCPATVGWRIKMHNEIPIARGLGSSAAATVAGRRGRQRPRRRSAHDRRATRSGHRHRGPPRQRGRRAAGRLRRVGRRPGRDVEAIRFDAPRDLRAVLFIPELRLATDDMREALPRDGPFGRRRREPRRCRDSAWPAWPRVGSTCSRWLTVDRLHEPYRASEYPQLTRLVDGGASGRCAGRVPVGCRIDRSSPSPTRCPGSPGSRRRCWPSPPTPTCPAGSPSSSRATPARRWSQALDPRGRTSLPGRLTRPSA